MAFTANTASVPQRLPALQRSQGGHELVFLDARRQSGAAAVIQAMVDFYQTCNVNTHGISRLRAKSTGA